MRDPANEVGLPVISYVLIAQYLSQDVPLNRPAMKFDPNQLFQTTRLYAQTFHDLLVTVGFQCHVSSRNGSHFVILGRLKATMTASWQ